MKLLNPFDQVGLLAFNAESEWAVPITEAGKREQIAGQLAALTHGGGTDLYKGLQEGLRVLQEVKAVKKHLIALSDGLTPNMDFETLMHDAVEQNITVTTVSLGRDADRTLMAAIAHWGRGRSYYTDDPLNIPRIFTAETILVSRGLIEEQPFQPAQRTEHELLRGIDIAKTPALYGYVVTYGKPAAEMLLTTIHVTVLAQRVSQVVVGAHMIRGQPYAFAVFADGFVQIALPGQHHGQVVMRDREIGVETEGLAVFFDGTVQVAARAQGESQVDTRVYELGVEPQSLAVFRDGTGNVAVLVEHGRQVVVPAEMIGVETHYLAVFTDSAVPVATLVQCDGQGVARAHMTGVETQHFAVLFEGAVEIVVLIQRVPENEHRLD